MPSGCIANNRAALELKLEERRSENEKTGRTARDAEG